MGIPCSREILATLDILGIASIAQVCAHTALHPPRAEVSLRLLTEDGRVVVDHYEQEGFARFKFYRRASPFLLKPLSASSYPGRQPTGTPPERTKVSVLRGWGR